MSMKQPGTEYGEKGETGEKEPKGAKASDSSGEKSPRNSKPDSTKGTPGESGEREPKAAKASDTSGEKKERMINGVGMGMMDDHGRESGGKERGEYNTGRKESEVYRHTRKSYQ